MSLFLEPDEESMRAPDEQNYTLSYPSTPSSLATTSGQDSFDAGNAWADICTSAEESYCVSHPMAWPSENSLTYPPTQTSPNQMLVDPSLAAYINPNVPESWLSSAGIHMPSATQSENVRHDSLLGCYPQSSFLPSQPLTAWNSFQQDVAPFRPTYGMSPGRSDYSVSSHNSGVASSSPYAHSEGCYPTRRSPIIKVEENCSEAETQFYASSNTTSPCTQHAHVNPGDVFNPPLLEADQQPTTPPLAPVKVEEDVKPILHSTPYGGLPAMATEEMRQAMADDRRKRGYTTPMNAVCSCDLCGKLFQRTSNLKAHMDTHKPDREQPWTCEYTGCGRRFVRKTDMTRHQESVHIKSRNFHCMLCYGSFARKDTLRRHIDDGCPRRAEHKKHPTRRRRASGSRSSSHRFGDFAGDFIVPKVERHQ